MSVLFCTPCYGWQMTTPCRRSYSRLESDLRQIGIDYDILDADNESLITRARSEMTRTFLKETDFERLMWIDADIGFTSDDVAKLWNMDADVAVGIYPMKKRDEEWYAAWVDGKLVHDLDGLPNPSEVDFAGTGFMMIRRSAIQKLWDAHPELAYDGPHGEVVHIWHEQIVNRHLDSEDYAFCRRWRALGGKIMADTSVRLVHYGMYGYGAA